MIYLINDDLCEIPFLKEIDFFLKNRISEFIYVVAVDKLHQLPFTPTKDTVLILLSEENCRIPSYIDKVKCVFKTGMSEENAKQFPNLFPFPLGYTKKFVTRPVIKNITERPIDVFFSGQAVTGDRIEMLQQLLVLKQSNLNLNIIHNITPTFLAGYSGETYSDIMYNSKICICPAGAMVESFRYYEAFKAGCVVFTKNYLPNTCLYEGAPIIKLEQWSQLAESINYFLSSTTLPQKYFYKTLNFHQEKYSAKAVANYIVDKINSLN